MDRITAIKATARNLRDLVVDTIPASLTGSFIDAAKLIHPVTNQLQGRDFYIYSGAGNGQERIITGFTPANNRMTFDESFGSMPSINSNFLVFQYFQKDEYDNALDRMIGLAGFKYMQDFVATISAVGTQYEYTVPSGFAYINDIRVVPTASDASNYTANDYTQRLFELNQRYWHIEANPLGSYLLIFDPRMIDMTVIDGNALRIRGQAKPNIGTLDTSSIPVELEEYVINGASTLLAAQRIDEGGEWKSKFQIFRDRTNELDDYIFRPKRGKPVG